jgi:hypothetical protein
LLSTARVSEKKPVVMIAPFPTDYQLEQIGKLVLVDRTRPWMLDKYFDAAHFRIIDKPMDQQTLFRELCEQLEAKALSARSFWIRLLSVKRSSAPCSATALRCRTPGLLAQKTVVYTVLAPHGMQGRRNRARYLPARHQQKRV